jgi:hypothetical protein
MLKVVVVLLIGWIVGYVLGNLFPVIDLISPLREVRLKSDVVIKAGMKGKTRYLQRPSLVNMPIELPLDSAIPQERLEQIPKT